MAMRNDGFNMIELLVVLAITAILAMMAVPSYQGKIMGNRTIFSLRQCQRRIARRRHDRQQPHSLGVGTRGSY
jgi:prepilin-type N-terminal cleavage/methylation domain-containing protein